jgi:adenosylcobinamide-GDP ribazoletransferase
MLKKEVRYFFTALMFYTRIPCPSWTDHSEEYLNKSRKYFPLIGWIVAGISVLAFLISSIVLPINVSIVLSMIASVLTTGAFHEDGFADVCDAFGGGWTKEQILTIMKDSRIGAYGGIGMILLLGLKFSLLLTLSSISIDYLVLGLWAAHASSRFIASTFIQTHDYVQDLDKSKSKPITSNKLSVKTMATSFVFVLIPILFFRSIWLVPVLGLAYLSKLYLANYFKKYIGGYTGDCLGTTQQVAEVVFYIGIIAINQIR